MPPRLSNCLNSGTFLESRSYTWDLLQLRSEVDLGLPFPTKLGFQGKVGWDLEAMLLFWDSYALKRKPLWLQFERNLIFLVHVSYVQSTATIRVIGVLLCLVSRLVRGQAQPKRCIDWTKEVVVYTKTDFQAPTASSDPKESAWWVLMLLRLYGSSGKLSLEIWSLKNFSYLYSGLDLVCDMTWVLDSLCCAGELLMQVFPEVLCTPLTLK